MIYFKDISIPKPCSVAYDSLPGNEVKRFCDSCQKHVYDFRGKDEAYLNEIFRLTGKVCGIYYEDQISKPGIYKPSWFQSFLNKVLTLGLFFKTFTISAAASDKQEITVQVSQASFQTDSVPAITATTKGKHPEKLKYQISIYIDDNLYTSHAQIYNNHIYLPDSITDNQWIKVIVHKKRSRRHRLKIKPKEYLFKYSEADKVPVQIVYKKRVIIVTKKYRRTLSGLIKK